MPQHNYRIPKFGIRTILISSLFFGFQGVTMPLVTLLGLVGNILSILVLRSPRIDMKVMVMMMMIMMMMMTMTMTTVTMTKMMMMTS